MVARRAIRPGMMRTCINHTDMYLYYVQTSTQRMYDGREESTMRRLLNCRINNLRSSMPIEAVFI